MGKEKNNEIEAVRHQLGEQIRGRLGKKSIEATDARDGLRDCFVSTYLGGVTEGLEGFNIKGGPKAVSKVIDSMFRRRLKAAGASWEAPTAPALQRVKHQIDQEIHFDGLPAELKEVHDQVCTLLIGKARGDLGHYGNRSAVKVESQKQSGGSDPTPPTKTKTQPLERIQSPSAAKTEQKAPNAVVNAMRSAENAQLIRMHEQSLKGASTKALISDVGRLMKLLDTEREVTNL